MRPLKQQRSPASRAMVSSRCGSILLETSGRPSRAARWAAYAAMASPRCDSGKGTNKSASDMFRRACISQSPYVERRRAQGLPSEASRLTHCSARELPCTGRIDLLYPQYPYASLEEDSYMTRRSPHMGWQYRAPWRTLLVLLWLVTQGSLALAGAPRSPYRVDDPEAEMWSLVRDSLHPADVAAFLQAYPNGKYAPAARLKLQQLQRPPGGPPPHVVPHTSTQAALPEPLSTVRN